MQPQGLESVLSQFRSDLVRARAVQFIACKAYLGSISEERIAQTVQLLCRRQEFCQIVGLARAADLPGLENHHIKKAEETVRSYEKREPSEFAIAARLALAMGDSERANKLFNKAIAQNENEGWLLAAGEIAKEAGKIHRARAIYDKRVSQLSAGLSFPDDLVRATAYSNIGAAHKAASRDFDAKLNFQSAYHHYASAGRFHAAALSAFEAGEIDDAIELFEKHLEQQCSTNCVGAQHQLFREIIYTRKMEHDLIGAARAAATAGSNLHSTILYFQAVWEQEDSGAFFNARDIAEEADFSLKVRLYNDLLEFIYDQKELEVAVILNRYAHAHQIEPGSLPNRMSEGPKLTAIKRVLRAVGAQPGNQDASPSEWKRAWVRYSDAFETVHGMWSHKVNGLDQQRTEGTLQALSDAVNDQHLLGYPQPIQATPTLVLMPGNAERLRFDPSRWDTRRKRFK